jgi:hypothetical protein
MIYDKFYPRVLFLDRLQKNDPHIGVLAGFLRSGWGKLSGKIHLDLKGFIAHYVRCKSAVFWQIGRDLSVFSTGTEKEHNTEISGFVRHMRRENGAQFGLILSYFRIPPL